MDISWPFTSTITQEQFLDWSLPPIFDEYPQDQKEFSFHEFENCSIPCFDKCMDDCQICGSFSSSLLEKNSIFFNILSWSHSRDSFQNLKLDFCYNDPFDIDHSSMPFSLFLEKIIIDNFLATCWTDWMDIVRRAIKIKVRQVLNNRLSTSIFNTLLKIRGRIFFKKGSMTREPNGWHLIILIISVNFKRLYLSMYSAKRYK